MVSRFASQFASVGLAPCDGRQPQRLASPPQRDTDLVARPHLASLAAHGGRRAHVAIVELEDPGGAKMRLHLKGGALPDVTALVRSFWGVEA